MPITPPDVVRRLTAAAAVSEKRELQLDKSTLIRVDKAINCCERNSVRVLGNVQSILNQIASQVGSVPKGGALAFVPGVSPVIRILTPSQYATWIRGIAVLEGSLVVGAVVLLSYAELAPLIETRASYEMLSLIGSAIGAYSRTAYKKRFECATCCRQYRLSQKHRRQRQKTKILRRL